MINSTVSKLASRFQPCVVGIDYSTTSPAICINVRDEFDFYYLTQTKKFAREQQETEHCTFNGQYFRNRDFDNLIGRYTFIMRWAIDILDRYDIDRVWLEDYAYAATGRVFNIGENTGILKFKLLQKEIPVSIVAPTEVKKSTVGKGNASKDEMIQEFTHQLGVDLPKLYDTTTMNPVSDIADSYFICRYGIQQRVLENFNV
jgi:Holliday junction resolvasome RuvABC endonuclease subunit